VQSYPHSWIAKTDESYVFIAEIDHKDSARSEYQHLDGIFRKEVPPVTASGGDSPPKIRHAKKQFDAIEDAYSNGLKCRLMLEKSTMYGTTPRGIKAAVDGNSWLVKELNGTVADGFNFVLERVE